MVSRYYLNNYTVYACYLSQVKPKNQKEALQEEAWISAIMKKIGTCTDRKIFDEFVHQGTWDRSIPIFEKIIRDLFTLKDSISVKL